MGDNGGSMQAVADYLNLWATEAPRVAKFHLLRYEDLRSSTTEQLRSLLDFMGIDATDAHVDAAVEYSSYENMKKMESKQQFRFAGFRIAPACLHAPRLERLEVRTARDFQPALLAGRPVSTRRTAGIVR